MNWFNKYILSLLPVTFLTLRKALETDPKARSTYREVCASIVKISGPIVLIFADDPEFAKLLED